MVYFVTQGAKSVTIYRGRMREMYSTRSIFLRIRDWIDGSSQGAGSFLALKEWRAWISRVARRKRPRISFS